jgi:glycosyltransferase 2 family protein
MKQRLVIAGQTVVTLALLAWIFSQEEVRENTLAVLRNADLRWVFAAVLVAGVETFLGACRWRIFLVVLGIRLPFWQTVRLFYLGLFFNTFLLGSVGGDAVKVLALIGQGQPKGPALLSVVMNRMSGLGALVLMSLTFMLWNYSWLIESPVVAGLIHFVFLYLFGVVALLALSLAAAWTGFGDRAPSWAPFRDKLAQMCELYFLFLSKWPKTLLAAGISCLMLMGYFLVFYCAMRAYGVAPDIGRVFAFMPVVDVISALPISLGGIGVREKLFVVLLGQLFGVPASTAVWISLTGFLMTLLWGLVGLMTLPFYRGWVARGRSLRESVK